MLMQLDFSCEEPIYLQIHNQLVLFIASGYLKPGDKLPSIRALANETGVNVMTVNKSYQMLKQEGYITADRRGGTVVAGNCPETSSAQITSELAMPAATAKLSGISCKQWLELCKQAYDSLNTDNIKKNVKE